MQPFKRVQLNKELRASSDGMPIFRQCFEHETLMSFDDDDGNYAFNEWWSAEGSMKFTEWLSRQEDWNYLVKWDKETE
jgi:hypothetical protein